MSVGVDVRVVAVELIAWEGTTLVELECGSWKLQCTSWVYR